MYNIFIYLIPVYLTMCDIPNSVCSDELHINKHRHQLSSFVKWWLSTSSRLNALVGAFNDLYHQFNRWCPLKHDCRHCNYLTQATLFTVSWPMDSTQHILVPAALAVGVVSESWRDQHFTLQPSPCGCKPLMKLGNHLNIHPEIEYHPQATNH